VSLILQYPQAKAQQGTVHVLLPEGQSLYLFYLESDYFGDVFDEELVDVS